MMFKAEWKRKYVRSPLKTSALFVDGDRVFNGIVDNISEGGLLLSTTDTFLHVRDIHLVISIPVLLDYRSIFDISGHLYKKPLGIEHHALRLHGMVVRNSNKVLSKEEGQSKIYQAGINFLELSSDHRAIIIGHINRFMRNMLFLLNLFSTIDKDERNILIIKQVALHLGYSDDMSKQELRQKLLHDYHNLVEL